MDAADRRDRDDEPADHYGPWAPRTPADVATLLADYAGTWWIAGGWAIEAFTDVTRRHADIDPSVMGCELPLFRRYLAGRLHVWTATRGALAPLPPEDRPEGKADEVLPEGCGQVWTRRGPLEPWEYDVLIVPGTPEEWVYKRDPSIRKPMADALWHRDGISYLRPEIQLLYKAPGLRAKDQADFVATLPHLARDPRAWLRAALTSTLPSHPWLESLP